MQAAPQIQSLWDNTFGPDANSDYAGKAYFIATNNWSGMTYPYSTALYNQSGGFSNGYVPLFGIIGNGNVVYYNDNGVSSISSKLKAAIDDFSPNSVVVTNPIEDLIMNFGESAEIDIDNVFSTEEGTLSYELVSVSNPEIASVELNGTILNVTAGNNPGITTVEVKAINGDYSATDEFTVTVNNPNSAAILEEGFEGEEFPPEGWSQIITCTVPDKTWIRYESSNDNPSHSGNANAHCQWDYATQDEWLITPTTTLGEQSVLKFYSKLSGQEATHPDKYCVQISTDDGATWTEIWTADKEIEGYVLATVSLTDYDGQDVQIAWQALEDNIAGGLWYSWDLDDITIESTTAIDENATITPSTVELFQNYPNPFNPSTTISFKIDNAANVKLSVFNANGELVEELVNNKLNAGVHNVDFNAAKLNSGVYYYRLEAEGVNMTKKMLLIK